MMNREGWRFVATSEDGPFTLIDTREPYPGREGWDKLGRIWNAKERLISTPISLGSEIKQGYWEEYEDDGTPVDVVTGSKEYDVVTNKLTGKTA